MGKIKIRILLSRRTLFLAVSLLFFVLGFSFYVYSGQTYKPSVDSELGEVKGQSNVQVAASLTPIPSPISEVKTPPLSSPSPIPQIVASSKPNTTNLLDSVNNYRQKNNKSVLILSGEVGCKFAKERLGEIHTNFSHNGFDEALSKTGKSAAAENLAKTSRVKNADFIVGLWSKSPGHNKNMLEDFSEGCGYYDGKFAVFLFYR